MKPIFHIAAAAGLLALGACSTGIDGGPTASSTAAAVTTLPAGAPQFASASAALPTILAQGNVTKVTYVARAKAPIISSGVDGYCPYR